MPTPDVRSAGAIVYRDSPEGPLYLLLRYESGHWDYAKGHIEPGESEEETTRREIVEETQLTDLEFLPGFRHALRYNYRHDGRLVLKEVVFFIARTTHGPDDVVLSHEHTDHAWLPYDEAYRRLTYRNAKDVLRAAHAHIRAASGS